MATLALKDLEIYQMSVALGDDAWSIYGNLDKSLKFHLGDQLLRAMDSIGANISEGYGRFHYLDSIKFYYNARGSLTESKYWIELLHRRELIDDTKYNDIIFRLDKLGVKLNNFITSIYKKNSSKQPSNNQ